MHVTAVPCGHCGHDLPFAAVACFECGFKDVGYPNVRYADDPAEAAALHDRVREAETLAARNGTADRLAAFAAAAAGSSAVLATSPSALYGVVNRTNQLMVSYYRAFRGAGSRIPEANKWDMLRESHDSRVNPQYHQELNYAALSLDGMGAGWYGGCNVVLRSDRIELRASVFEENPFNFLKDENRRLPPDEVVPPGHRASWPRRGELAVAKLHAKVRADTLDAEFPAILLERDAARGDTDFIEVHIYGPLAPGAFEVVRAAVPFADEDEALAWESVKRRLDRLGIPIEERPNT